MTKIKKTRKKKTAVLRPAESKVYLNGNCYAKLSGVYLTALDNASAINEWSSIPYLQSLYGAELIGFSTLPGDSSSSQNFIAKNAASPIPTAGETYYPIYQRKVYNLYEDGEGDAWTDAISSLIDDLRWLDKENIMLGLNIEDKELSPNEKIDVLLKDSRTIELIKNGESKLFVVLGNFKISALLDGSNAISDWIDTDGTNIEDINIETLEVVPKTNLTEEELEYKNFVGEIWNIDEKKASASTLSSVEKMTNIMLDTMCGDYSKAISQNTYSLTPIKTPFLFNRPRLTWEQYYSDLGIPLSDEWIANKFSRYGSEAPTKALEYLSSTYSNIDIPYGPFVKYEATISPSRDGWYKFLVNGDDFTAIAIDDKLIAFDNYSEIYPLFNGLNYLYQKSLETYGQIGSFLDPNQIQKLSSQIGRSDIDTVSFALSSLTNVGLSTDSLSSNLLAERFDSGYAKDFYSNIRNLNDEKFIQYVSIYGTGIETCGAPLSASMASFSHGAYIFLVGGNRYKFTMWHNDFYSLKYYALSVGSIQGENGYGACVHWHKDESISSLEETNLSTANTVPLPGWSRNINFYPTGNDIFNACLSVEAGLYNDKMDTPELSAWRNKGYELVPSGNYCFSPGLYQVFTIRELSDKEKEDLSKNTYCVSWYAAMKKYGNQAVSVKNIFASVQQYLLKGPISFS